jgi:hypothetical protein
MLRPPSIYSHAEVTWAMMEEANSTLSFQEYCLLANDYGIVPNLVTVKMAFALYDAATRVCYFLLADSRNRLIALSPSVG